MMCLVTKNAPDLTAKALMPDGSVKDIKLSDFRGKYVVLFFYPADFSPICPAELVHFNRQIDQFRERECVVLAASVDSIESHRNWINTPLSEGGIGKVSYPIISDPSKELTRSFGILHDKGVALRGLFLIDRQGVVRHQVINDLPLTRGVEETLRMVDVLRQFEEFGNVCPPDWKEGDSTFKPDKDGVSGYLSRLK